MEQKKEKTKRWRPSLTQYRALEAEIRELKARNVDLNREITYLRNRSFLQRVFNK